MSTTSKRPNVAKLSFHVTPGHSRLIFSDTSLAKALKSLGSSKACGEMRLRITYVAIWHLPYNYPRRHENRLMSTSHGILRLTSPGSPEQNLLTSQKVSYVPPTTTS